MKRGDAEAACRLAIAHADGFCIRLLAYATAQPDIFID
jgi:hypothetical protein